jgi:hypothetical protein
MGYCYCHTTDLGLKKEGICAALRYLGRDISAREYGLKSGIKRILPAVLCRGNAKSQPKSLGKVGRTLEAGPLCNFRNG